ncbi:hypothetical protein Gbfr_009_026 [Gluconobacter frateurii M-2]|nr:hypothetical protein Gbfr_009_026 [Gluconobacter frateurii M-2]
MNAVRQVLIEDRRWYVLDAIAQMADRRLNADVVLMSIRAMGRPATAQDIQEDLEHLEREGCVLLDRMTLSPGRTLWIATLTIEGLQARDNARHVPGVAARRPL